MVSFVGLFALDAGCSTPATPPVTAGNAGLGITQFQVNETAESTTIVGLDAQNQEVARLDFVHGRFMMSKEFGEPYGGTVVDGRSVHAQIQGHKFDWQTVGYTDTSHMPAFPDAESLLTAFLADNHVKPVLAQWQIGWEVKSATALPDGERQYDVDCDSAGTSWASCPDHFTCYQTQAPGTTVACGGSYLLQGMTFYGSSQDMVSMCCSSGFRDSGFFAEKTCAHDGTSSSCGSGTKCVACWSFPWDDHCSVYAVPNGNAFQDCHDYL
jgi:hypothetical protein